MIYQSLAGCLARYGGHWRVQIVFSVLDAPQALMQRLLGDQSRRSHPSERAARPADGRKPVDTAIPESSGNIKLMFRRPRPHFGLVPAQRDTSAPVRMPPRPPQSEANSAHPRSSDLPDTVQHRLGLHRASQAAMVPGARRGTVTPGRCGARSPAAIHDRCSGQRSPGRFHFRLIRAFSCIETGQGLRSRH